MPDRSDYQQVLEDVGMLCVQWALLGRQIELFVRKLMDCSPETAAVIVTSAGNDIAARAETVQKLVYASEIQFPPDWVQAFDNLIRLVRTKIRDDREAFIHGLTVDSPKGIIRIDHAVSRVGGGATGATNIAITKEREVMPDDVFVFYHQVHTIGDYFWMGMNDIRAWREIGRFPEIPGLCRVADEMEMRDLIPEFTEGPRLPLRTSRLGD